MSGVLASAATSTAVTSAVTLIVGVAGGGSLVALLRVKVDKDRVVIDAAQGALIVTTGVIDALREELNRVKESREEDARKIAQLQAGREEDAAKITKLERAREADQVKLARLQAAYDADAASWAAERAELRRRVAAVEDDTQ